MTTTERGRHRDPADGRASRRRAAAELACAPYPYPKPQDDDVLFTAEPTADGDLIEQAALKADALADTYGPWTKPRALTRQLADEIRRLRPRRRKAG
jgi:hypothetical protein